MPSGLAEGSSPAFLGYLLPTICKEPVGTQGSIHDRWVGNFITKGRPFAKGTAKISYQRIFLRSVSVLTEE